MIPKISPLQIVDFALTSFEFSINFPDENQDINDYTKQYAIDIDFGLNNDEFLRAVIKAEINKSENSLPGYVIMAEAVCVFDFEKGSELPDNIKNDLEGFSTIYIALNSLRGLISNITANAPFGRYILPSIDLNDLIEKKRQKILDKQSVKTESDKKKRKVKPKVK